MNVGLPRGGGGRLGELGGRLPLDDEGRVMGWWGVGVEMRKVVAVESYLHWAASAAKAVGRVGGRSRHWAVVGAGAKVGLVARAWLPGAREEGRQSSRSSPGRLLRNSWR